LDGGQKKSDEDADDGDHDEEFNEGKCAARAVGMHTETQEWVASKHRNFSGQRLLCSD
jgi:hypothetical protein